MGDVFSFDAMFKTLMMMTKSFDDCGIGFFFFLTVTIETLQRSYHLPSLLLSISSVYLFNLSALIGDKFLTLCQRSKANEIKNIVPVGVIAWQMR